MTKYELPALPYGLADLEPVISKEIMDIHYNRHHNTYVQNLNQLLEKYHAAETHRDLPAMVALQSGIKFNAGGHINHTLFWESLIPKNQGQGEPSGKLAEAINAQFGSFKACMEAINGKTVAVQGSGWGWLGLCPQSKKLSIATCANQDPLSTTGLIPLLGIDVWEHAYYLQYKNARADYLKAIWEIINWKKVEERYLAAH